MNETHGGCSSFTVAFDFEKKLERGIGLADVNVAAGVWFVRKNKLL